MDVTILAFKMNSPLEVPVCKGAFHGTSQQPLEKSGCQGTWRGGWAKLLHLAPPGVWPKAKRDPAERAEIRLESMLREPPMGGVRGPSIGGSEGIVLLHGHAHLAAARRALPAVGDDRDVITVG